MTSGRRQGKTESATNHLLAEALPPKPRVVYGEFHCNCGGRHNDGPTQQDPRVYKCKYCEAEIPVPLVRHIFRDVKSREEFHAIVAAWKARNFVKHYSNQDFSDVEVPLMSDGQRLAQVYERTRIETQKSHDEYCNTVKPLFHGSLDGQLYRAFHHGDNIFIAQMLPNGHWRYPFTYTIPLIFFRAYSNEVIDALRRV